jgi:hypothetical protein
MPVLMHLENRGRLSPGAVRNEAGIEKCQGQ